MNTKSSPVHFNQRSFKESLLEHLTEADRFLVLIRDPDGELSYSVKGTPEEIRVDIDEFTRGLK